MASYMREDAEAVVFARPQGTAAPETTHVKREWHQLKSPVSFASEYEMRFGPRTYTPAQRLVIDRATSERSELSAPQLPRL